VANFCDGVLHAGYDPLTAVDSSQPLEGAILIRDGGTIHYSRSDGTPPTVHGNRCARYATRGRNRAPIWIEEIALDTSDPNLYHVSYHLPYEPNSSYPEESYPRAQIIRPFGNRIRWSITGLREEAGKFVLAYRTICMETASLAPHFDVFSSNPQIMAKYIGADVTIFIDGTEQAPARIAEFGQYLLPVGREDPPDRWQYCLSADWEAGNHNMRIVVSAISGDTLTLEWKFTVPAQTSESG
jgi:hypothetical protein